MKIAALTLIVSAFALAGAAQTVQAESADSAQADGPSPEAAAADAENWRAVDPDNLFIFETTAGRVLIEAFPEIAPGHVNQFRTIIRSGDYDGTSFHRVLNTFMAQGGDIRRLHGRDSGLPNMMAEFSFKRDLEAMPLDFSIGPQDFAMTGYYKGAPMATQPAWLATDFGNTSVESWIPHCPGVVSTARLGDDVNSANSQFFLMRQYNDHLDKNYTAWGRVVEGLDVVQSIKHGPDATDGQVFNPDILTSAQVAADLPEADRPTVWVMRTDGPAFPATVNVETEPHVCELPPVPAVTRN